MTKSELKNLRKAIKSVCKPWHSLYIEGEAFSCIYKNGTFMWAMPSGAIVEARGKDILLWIGDGKYITYFSYDYGKGYYYE